MSRSAARAGSLSLVVFGLVAAGLSIAGALGAFDPSSPHVNQFSVSPVVRPDGSPSQAAQTPFVPKSYSIPALDLHRVKIIPEPDPGGSLVIPPIADGVAWWSGGALAGAEAGTTLLAGHVDWVGFGNGPMQKIWYVRPGMEAILYGPNGQARFYEAVSLVTVNKSNFASKASNLISSGGPNRLVMVTCGGTFEPLAHNWNSDVVATFVPLGSR